MGDGEKGRGWGVEEFSRSGLKIEKQPVLCINAFLCTFVYRPLK
jgi:hypothetical protein